MPNSIDEEWFTPGEIDNPAKEDRKWTQVANPSPVTEGSIRFFRGIEPLAIKTEFAGPLTPAEKQEFETLLDYQIKGKELTNDQDTRLSNFKVRALTGNVKFYVDDYERAKDYAKGGVVYFLDVPREDAEKWRVENLKAESAIKIPFEIAKRATLYAVGPKAPSDLT